MDFSQCIADEMVRFEETFEQILHTRVPLANNVIRYFLDRKGKQLRPRITLLTAKMIHQDTLPQATIYGAVALELLHNASLMHDDVVDTSEQRRGDATVNKVWDNKVAVLMGDLFLSKCLTASNATGSLAVSEILSGMVTRLSEGELEQLSNMRARMLSEEAYFSVISGKTASLFAACMQVGAHTVNATAEEVQRVAEIGERMGLIFQIRDDIFDYFPSNDEVGKPTGHDIMEGKVTLPLLYALQHASADEAQHMKSLLDDNEVLSADQVAELVNFAKAMGGIEYAQAKMKKIAFETKSLLQFFPDSPYRSTLLGLVDYFIERSK